MAIADSVFANSYTFEIADIPQEHRGVADAIEANAIAVIEYVSDFVEWEGTLDFVVRFGSPTMFGFPGTGLLPAYGGLAPDGRTYALVEATGGGDANGEDWDLGAWILPHVNGELLNYETPLYFDPDPDPYAAPEIPPGTHDFFSIYLHEVLHGLGIWSLGEAGADAFAFLDRLSVDLGGQRAFVGNVTEGLLGEPLPWSSRTEALDHYGAPAGGEPGPIDRGIMWEFGFYEQNRWHLGQVDLAILADLGHRVANEGVLPLTEQPDALYEGIDPQAVAGNTAPNAEADSITATAGQTVTIPAATLLANDSDPDGDTLTIRAVEATGTGSVALTAEGDVAFTAAAGTGPDRFDYTVSDGAGGTDTATVSVSVEEPPRNLPQIGTAGDDTLMGTDGDDFIIGGGGTDTVLYPQLAREDVTVSADAEGTRIAFGEETDTLLQIERVAFSDGTLVYELSANAPLVYRLYAASLARTPDEAGLRFWTDAADAGTTRGELAGAFVQSTEFAEAFLADPSDEAFVDALYRTVLDRPSSEDPGGRDFWLEAFQTGGLGRADMLIAFAESPENVAATAPDIADGYWTV